MRRSILVGLALILMPAYVLAGFGAGTTVANITTYVANPYNDAPVTANKAEIDALHVSTTSSRVVCGSSVPAHAIDISSEDYVGIATMTVTLKGNRQASLRYSINTINGAGAPRTYTAEITANSELLDGEVTLTNAGNASEVLHYNIPIESTTAGVNTFCINIKSSSDVGTQTAELVEICIVEY